MPFLPGYAFTDASGNPIVDGVGGFIQEQAENAVGLIDDVRAIWDSIVGTGHGSWSEGLARYYLAIYTGNPEWLTTGYSDPDVTEANGRIGFIYNWTEPGMSNPANLRLLISEAAQLVRTDPASPHLATIADVLARLGEPVVLPETPPGGYGGTGATAEDVWSYVSENYVPHGPTMDQLLAWAGAFGRNFGNAAAGPLKGNPFIQVEAEFSEGSAYAGSIAAVYCDVANILVTDTVQTWLERNNPTFEFYTDERTGLIYCYLDPLPGPENYKAICTLTDAELQAIRAGYGAGNITVSGGAPVWPGLANVELGTPVALQASVVVAGPLDGVLINFTSLPSNYSNWPIGDQTFYFKLGDIAFVTDRGDVEPRQFLGFTDAIYTPSTMKQANGAILRVLGGAEGTATPYTIAV